MEKSENLSFVPGCKLSPKCRSFLDILMFIRYQRKRIKSFSILDSTTFVVVNFPMLKDDEN